MKSMVAPGALLVAVMIGLSSCVYPPYPPPPPPIAVAPPLAPYFAPAPIPPPPYVAYRRCGPGSHWVRPHHNRWGRWVPGHCRRNW